MARPSKGGRQIQVRLPEDDIQELEAWVSEMRSERPGMSGITRSDLMRDIIMNATAEHREARMKSAKRARSRPSPRAEP